MPCATCLDALDDRRPLWYVQVLVRSNGKDLTMIRSVVFRKNHTLRQYRNRVPVPGSDVSGWAWTIPFFATHDRMTFEPGLTILFGPNGSGKSTVLDLIARPACCWHYDCVIPCMTGPYDVHNLSLDDTPNVADPHERYLTALHAHHGGRTPAGRADIEWDGAPVFLQDFRGAVARPSSIAIEEDMTRLAAADSRSSGESALLILEGGLRHLEDLARTYSAGAFRSAIDALSQTAVSRSPRGFGAQRWTDVDVVADIRKYLDRAQRGWFDIRRNELLAWRDYMLSMPIGDRVTALLDEPDAHLSIPAQAELWRRLERLAANVQLVVATHSPFALSANATIIEMVPGYVDACRAALRTLVQTIR